MHRVSESQGEDERGFLPSRRRPCGWSDTCHPLRLVSSLRAAVKVVTA